MSCEDWSMSVNILNSISFFFVVTNDTSNFQACPSVWMAVTVGGHRPVWVTLDTQLMWVTHVHRIGQKAVQRLGLLSTVL